MYYTIKNPVVRTVLILASIILSLFLLFYLLLLLFLYDGNNNNNKIDGCLRFEIGDLVPIQFGALTSVTTLLKKDPRYGSILPMCQIEEGEGGENKEEEEQEERANTIVNDNKYQQQKYKMSLDLPVHDSPLGLEIRMLQDVFCQKVCDYIPMTTRVGVATDHSSSGGGDTSDSNYNNNINQMIENIATDYHNNWIIDGLPSAYLSSEYGYKSRDSLEYNGGFPIGFNYNEQYYVYNHFKILLDYYDHLDGTYSVVRFDVAPSSLKHENNNIGSINRSKGFNNATVTVTKTTTDQQQEQKQQQQYQDKEQDLSICGMKQGINDEYESMYEAQPILLFKEKDEKGKKDKEEGEESTSSVLFTYDVIWTKSFYDPTVERSVYLSNDHLIPNMVHWYSLQNGLFLALIFAAIIAFLLFRNIRADLVNSHDDDKLSDHTTDTNETPSLSPTPRSSFNQEREQELEEKGWKLVNTEIFLIHDDGERYVKPSSLGLLAGCCGTGAQLICICLGTLLLLTGGIMLNVTNKGQLYNIMLKSILCMIPVSGLMNGYVYGYLCQFFSSKTFTKQKQKKRAQRQQYNNNDSCWQKSIIWSIFVFPIFTMTTFLIGYGMAWKLSPSVYADFCKSYAVMLLIAFTVSGILVLVGAKIGYNRNNNSSSSHVPPHNTKPFLIGFVFYWNAFAKMKVISQCFVVLLAFFFSFVTIPLVIFWYIKRSLAEKNYCRNSLCEKLFFLMIGGLTSFCCLYVDIFFLLMGAIANLWYNTYGFLFLAVCTQLLLCSEMAIIFGYYQVLLTTTMAKGTVLVEGETSSASSTTVTVGTGTKNNNTMPSPCSWWWWQFASSGLFFCIWFVLFSSFRWHSLMNTDINDSMAIAYFTTIVYIGISLALMNGCVSILSSIWLVQKILHIANKDNNENNDYNADRDTEPLVDIPTIMMTEIGDNEGKKGNSSSCSNNNDDTKLALT